jgi:GAF domain-containing protein
MTASLHPYASQGCDDAISPVTGDARVASASAKRPRLFTKYDTLLVAIIGTTLLSGGIFEIFSHYREHRTSLIRIQHEQAKAAAAKIGQFIEDIEGQLGWTTQIPWSAGAPDNRRFDALRLLRQVPAITELSLVDAGGRERLRVSRLAMDVVDSGVDLSRDPKFTEAVAHKVYYGPVYFRRESEPYMTLALAGTRKDAGVTIAEVNLKLIWDLVSQIKVGNHGHAYIVSGRGRLIAHPDMSLVLRDTDMSKLAQVQAAQAGTDTVSDALDGTQDIQGQEVLTAFAPIRPLRWTMFIERPADEAYASLYAALQRLAVVLFAAAVFAALVGMLLTRRFAAASPALRAWAENVGVDIVGQKFSGSPDVKVGQSSAELRDRVQPEVATPDVLGIIGRATYGLQATLDTLVESVARHCSADCASIDRKSGDQLQQLASYGFSAEFSEWRKKTPIALDQNSIVCRALIEAKPVQILDVITDLEFTELEAQKRAGFRTVLAAPLMLCGEAIGVLLMTRAHPQLFSAEQIELITTFANLAAIMIENVRPLSELLNSAEAAHMRSD